MSAGTGGTSATIGRYIRYQQLATQLTVVDPEHSVFHSYYQTGRKDLTNHLSSRIEGIGRPRVEPSFIPSVIDNMMTVPDAASVACMLWLQQKLNRKVGPSTGTNLFGVLKLAQQMQSQQESGSIVTLICDSGERYLDCYYDEKWVERHIGSLQQHQAWLAQWH